MAQEVMNTEAFKGHRPAKAFDTLDPHSESLADGIGSSYGVIGYKGKVWSLRYKGEKHTIVRPDDGTPSSYIDMIILQQAKQKSKSYYLEYDPGGTSEGSRPICASIDGVVPDVDVQTKQSDTCALCPRNVWKTDANGRKGRECNDYKRLAVLLMPNTTQRVLGQKLMEPVFLRVPAGSLNNLSLMGEQMAQQGWHFSTFITRVSFNPDKAHPEMVFTALQGLSDAEAPVVLPLRADPQAIRIIGEDKPKRLAPPSAVGVSGGLQGEIIPPTATQNPAQSGLPGKMVVPTQNPGPPMPPPNPATAQVTQSVAPVDIGLTAVDTGLSGTLSATAPAEIMTKSPSEPATVTVADVGEATDSDAALDARLALLLPKMPQ